MGIGKDLREIYAIHMKYLSPFILDDEVHKRVILLFSWHDKVGT